MTNSIIIEKNVTQENAQNIAHPSVFNFNSSQVRTINRDGVVWFVASDVCSALGYVNPSKAIADHLDDDERSTITNSESRNGGGLLIIINESGLYALVLRSRKPEARKFAKWVTSEVLPAIRKTGEYRAPYVVNPNDSLNAAQAEQLRLALKEGCDKLPKEKQGAFMTKGWSKLKSHFGCTYRNIPQREFTEALSLVNRHSSEWELLDAPQGKGNPVEPGDISDKDYYHECRDELFKFAESLPPGSNFPQDEAVRQRIADGYLTDILKSRRWLISFNQNGAIQMAPVEKSCCVINPDSISNVSTLIDEFIPSALLPKVISTASDRINRIMERSALHGQRTFA